MLQWLGKPTPGPRSPDRLSPDFTTGTDSRSSATPAPSFCLAASRAASIVSTKQSHCDTAADVDCTAVTLAAAAAETSPAVQVISEFAACCPSHAVKSSAWWLNSKAWAASTDCLLLVGLLVQRQCQCQCPGNWNTVTVRTLETSLIYRLLG